ncbi:murein biosynthesis integral membrane protein MurJ [Patescibacteria group bacterium]|nr:murein biosynthesis integral membrane protein MurJ [Patescibacteria group bacterium]MBU4512168.1 murein biosynthesis integral membrane protein MurJ [Patescibacteria group bacterium]MCG2693028.1 murein biosynthesis integral membrane protein MurJ [Candidatus Parcubacteria bacterium]
MFQKFIHKLKNTITGGAIVIASFSVLSKFIGLLRDRLIASNFGAGDITDIYFASFRLPDLIFNTLVLGALSSAFIPIFIKCLQKDKEEAFRIANSILHCIVLALAILAGIFFIFAPRIVPLLVPGFDPEKQRAVAELTRIMLFSIIFFGASNVFSGILNSFKRFVAYSLAPIFYNLGIIAGVLFLVPRFGIKGLAWGVVLGAFLHLLIQIPSVLKAGFRWQAVLAFKDRAVQRVGLLMLPRTFGLAVNQINQLVINVIASTLVVGSVAVFNFAFNLQSFPIGIFAISLAVASFPYFSESAAKKDLKEFIAHFSVTLRRILFLIIPASVFILLLRAQVVRLVLGAGRFDWQDTVMTLETLGFFSISLFAQALIPLLARAFYAFQDTKTPVFVSIVSVLINIFGGLYLSRILGVAGLALAFSIASIVNVILLFVLLRCKLGFLDEKKIIFSLLKVSMISVLAGVAVQISKMVVGSIFDLTTFGQVLLQFLVAAGVGGLVYLGLALVFKCEEIGVIKKLKV